MKNIILVFFVGLFSLTISAQKARVKGVVLDEFNNPVENVTITIGYEEFLTLIIDLKQYF